MTGTAVGQMAVAVRFTTTTMCTYPIHRSHRAVTILRTGPRTGRGESAALAVWAALVAPAA
jgi:hypothetical protein